MLSVLLTAQKLYLSYTCQQKAAELRGREDCLALYQFTWSEWEEKSLEAKHPTENALTSKRREDQASVKAFSLSVAKSGYDDVVF